MYAVYTYTECFKMNLLFVIVHTTTGHRVSKNNRITFAVNTSSVYLEINPSQNLGIKIFINFLDDLPLVMNTLIYE